MRGCKQMANCFPEERKLSHFSCIIVLARLPNRINQNFLFSLTPVKLIIDSAEATLCDLRNSSSISSPTSAVLASLTGRPGRRWQWWRWMTATSPWPSASASRSATTPVPPRARKPARRSESVSSSSSFSLLLFAF